MDTLTVDCVSQNMTCIFAVRLKSQSLLFCGVLSSHLCEFAKQYWNSFNRFLSYICKGNEAMYVFPSHTFGRKFVLKDQVNISDVGLFKSNLLQKGIECFCAALRVSVYQLHEKVQTVFPIGREKSRTLQNKAALAQPEIVYIGTRDCEEVTGQNRFLLWSCTAKAFFNTILSCAEPEMKNWITSVHLMRKWEQNFKKLDENSFARTCWWKKNRWSDCK